MDSPLKAFPAPRLPSDPAARLLQKLTGFGSARRTACLTVTRWSQCTCLLAAGLLIFSQLPVPAAGRITPVPGPESQALLPGARGWILTSPAADGIAACELPSLAVRTVQPPHHGTPQDRPNVHALAGPDDDGRIAYLEDHFFCEEASRRHLLKSIQLDGSGDRTIFSRPGDAMWSSLISDSLALAPTGGRVAFVSQMQPLQMPSAYLRQGTIEVWNLSTGKGGPVGIDAVDMGLAWFPNGTQLAFVRMSDPRSLPPDRILPGFPRWPLLPTVCILDITKKRVTPVCTGSRPVVAPDGRKLLVSNHEGTVHEIELASGSSRPVTWAAHSWPGAIAIPCHDVVLSWAPRTKGQPNRRTSRNSPLAGPKDMLTLKLNRLSTNEIHTVLPLIDPRTPLSFGQTRSQRR